MSMNSLRSRCRDVSSVLVASPRCRCGAACRASTGLAQDPVPDLRAAAGAAGGAQARTRRRPPPRVRHREGDSRRSASARGRRTRTSGSARSRRSSPSSRRRPRRRGRRSADRRTTSALAIAGASLAYAVEQDPKYLTDRQGVDARGHRLRALGLHVQQAQHRPRGGPSALRDRLGVRPAVRRVDARRARAHPARRSSATPRSCTTRSRPKPGRRFNFTQNHDFIPTAGLAVAALALMGESPDAPKWAALARAHHHRAGQLLSPDGYYYEGMEYWIFSTPWLVHFLDAWEHSTGESLWERGQFRNWKHLVAHIVLPDGQTVFDFGDIWQGPLTRAKQGEDYAREYPGGHAARATSTCSTAWPRGSRTRRRRPSPTALRGVRPHQPRGVLDAAVARSRAGRRAHEPTSRSPITSRTRAWCSTGPRGTPTPPPSPSRPARRKGIASTALLAQVPEWRLSSGHAHPDAGSFIIWAAGPVPDGRHRLRRPAAGAAPQHDHRRRPRAGRRGRARRVARRSDQAALDAIRITRLRWREPRRPNRGRGGRRVS